MDSPVPDLLDTNIFVHLIRDDTTGQRLKQARQLLLTEAVPAFCIVTEGELRSLAYQFNWGETKVEQMRYLLDHFRRIPIDPLEVMAAYAVIDAYSKSIGISIGKNDVWIAAVAHFTGFELLTTDREARPIHAWKRSQQDAQTTTTLRKTQPQSHPEAAPCPCQHPATTSDGIPVADRLADGPPDGSFTTRSNEPLTHPNQSQPSSDTHPTEPVQEARTIRKQTGNPSYLRIALDAINAIRNIWGLDAPKEMDPPEAIKEWPKALIGIDIDKI